MYTLKIFTDNNPDHCTEYKFDSIIELKQFVRLFPVWEFAKVEVINESKN